MFVDGGLSLLLGTFMAVIVCTSRLAISHVPLCDNFVFYFYFNSHLKYIYRFRHIGFIFLTSLFKSRVCSTSLYSSYYLAHRGPSITLVNLKWEEGGLIAWFASCLICSLSRAGFCSWGQARPALRSLPSRLSLEGMSLPSRPWWTKRIWSPLYSVLPNIHCSDKSSIG